MPRHVTAVGVQAFREWMNEQADHSSGEGDDWPLPSLDVLRELDPPAVVWSEQDAAAMPPTRLPARG